MAKFKTTFLSIGNNRTLGKSIGIFNLPQGMTCPGKTDLCRSICYACKAERCYFHARSMRVRNLSYIRNQGVSSFIPAMIEEIKKSHVTMVRIHESGDFYNQEYLDAWVTIVKACHKVKFLSYTKSFMYDWSVAIQLPNWSIIWSIDKTTKLPIPTQSTTAYLRTTQELAPSGAVTCQHTADKHYCGTQCHICWNAHTGSDKRIYLDQH